MLILSSSPAHAHTLQKARVITLEVSAFTSNIQMRHPIENGGAYWLFSFILSLASLPLAATYYDSAVGNDDITNIARTCCYVILPSVIFLKIIFFVNIERKYLKTFWSLKRGTEVTLEHFESTEDSVKAIVFVKNRRHWKKIEGEVEKWVRDNWKKWMVEEPDWFDDNLKARIPPHMIPNISDRERVAEMQSMRRQSSIMGSASKIFGAKSGIGTRVEKVQPEN